MSQRTVQNHQEALNVLVQAAQAANKRGAFTLEESGLISSAVTIFSPPGSSSSDETIGQESDDSWEEQLEETVTTEDSSEQPQ